METSRIDASFSTHDHASHDDLRRAFRRRLLATHPDHGGNTETFVATLNALRSLDGATPITQTMTSHRATSVDTRVDTYDCTPMPRRRATTTTPTFADFLNAAVRQHVGAA